MDHDWEPKTFDGDGGFLQCRHCHLKHDDRSGAPPRTAEECKAGGVRPCSGRFSGDFYGVVQVIDGRKSWLHDLRLDAARHGGAIDAHWTANANDAWHGSFEMADFLARFWAAGSQYQGTKSAPIVSASCLLTTPASTDESPVAVEAPADPREGLIRIIELSLRVVNHRSSLGLDETEKLALLFVERLDRYLASMGRAGPYR